MKLFVALSALASAVAVLANPHLRIAGPGVRSLEERDMSGSRPDNLCPWGSLMNDRMGKITTGLDSTVYTILSCLANGKVYACYTTDTVGF